MKLFLLLASILATIVVAAPADAAPRPNCKKCLDFWDVCHRRCGGWPMCRSVCNCKTRDHEECKYCPGGYPCLTPEAQADDVEELSAENADIAKNSVDVMDVNIVKKADNVEQAASTKNLDVVKKSVDVEDVVTVTIANKDEADISGDPMCHKCREYYHRCRNVSLARYRDPQDLK
jgi:hypothetical protein